MLQQSGTASAAGDLATADAQLSAGVHGAAQAVNLRQSRPPQARPAVRPLYTEPWFNSRCVALESQVKRAKRLFPHSHHLRLLQRRYSKALERSQAAFHKQQVLDLSDLLKFNPHLFWQQAKLPVRCFRMSCSLLQPGMASLLL